MGKKTNTTNLEAPVKRAIKTKPAAEKAPPAKPAAAAELPVKPAGEKTVARTSAGKTPALKPAAAKPKAATRAAKPTASAGKRKLAFSQDDIALRAYYIAERRLSAGIHADPQHDWIEAERQLSYEAGTTVAPKAKKARS